ncbi:MAG: hypothetical protein D6737_04735 [Chloroflexi bacterium]|nr:MAG: hypothetical protein D6737_04735 [Chloroflexota bacterium]
MAEDQNENPRPQDDNPLDWLDEDTSDSDGDADESPPTSPEPEAEVPSWLTEAAGTASEEADDETSSSDETADEEAAETPSSDEASEEEAAETSSQADDQLDWLIDTEAAEDKEDTKKIDATVDDDTEKIEALVADFEEPETPSEAVPLPAQPEAETTQDDEAEATDWLLGDTSSDEEAPQPGAEEEPASSFSPWHETVPDSETDIPAVFDSDAEARVSAQTVEASTPLPPSPGDSREILVMTDSDDRINPTALYILGVFAALVSVVAILLAIGLTDVQSDRDRSENELIAAREQNALLATENVEGINRALNDSATAQAMAIAEVNAAAETQQAELAATSAAQLNAAATAQAEAIEERDAAAATAQAEVEDAAMTLQAEVQATAEAEFDVVVTEQSQLEGTATQQLRDAMTQQAAAVASIEADSATQQAQLRATATQQLRDSLTQQAIAVQDMEDAAATEQARIEATAEAELHAEMTERAEAVTDVAESAATQQARLNATAEAMEVRADTALTRQAELQRTVTAIARQQNQSNIQLTQAAAAVASEEFLAQSIASSATAALSTAQAQTDEMIENAAAGADLATAQAQVAAAQTAQAFAEATAQSAQATTDALAESAAAPPTPAVIEGAAPPGGDLPLADVPVGGLIFRETFDNNSNGWVIGPIEDAGSIELGGGVYQLVINASPGNVLVSNFPIVDDGYLEAEVGLSDCPPSGFFGIRYRAPAASGGYVFVISCDLSFWRIDTLGPNNNFENLGANRFTPMNADPTVRHVIGVRAVGEKLSIYFDGVELGSVTDDRFAEGAIGFYAETTEDPLAVQFDNLRVWLLDEDVGDGASDADNDGGD